MGDWWENARDYSVLEGSQRRERRPVAKQTLGSKIPPQLNFNRGGSTLESRKSSRLLNQEEKWTRFGQGGSKCCDSRMRVKS